jgi:uncharacterized protein (TIGR00730 family)
MHPNQRPPDSSSNDRYIIDRMERGQSWRLLKIMAEFVEGFETLAERTNSVTIYGSARVGPGDPLYEQARELGKRLASHGYSVVTGGGPGVMEAANRGAAEAGGQSIGISIDLPHERPNQYSTTSLHFHYFFVRKVMLVWRAQAFVLMPGGLGTLDELFETATLIATEKINRFPVVLFGKDYWDGLATWLRDYGVERGYLRPTDFEMFTLTDDLDEVMNVLAAWAERRKLEGEPLPERVRRHS